MDPIQQLIDRLPSLLEDPNELSKCVVNLSALNYNVAIEMAKARFNQESAAKDLLDASIFSDKKMAVSEAEKRAIVDTGNRYEQLKNQYEAVVELVNSLKKRIEILGWEYRHP